MRYIIWWRVLVAIMIGKEKIQQMKKIGQLFTPETTKSCTRKKIYLKWMTLFICE